VPITQAHLINHTNEFVRDYPFIMDRRKCTAEEPNVKLRNKVGLNMNTVIMEQSKRHKKYTMKWDWFSVNNGPQPYQWIGAMALPIKAEIIVEQQMPGGGGTIQDKRAYFLPWKRNSITSMPLGNDANFFFTAPLSGCKIYIHFKNGRDPILYHANSGDIPKAKKEEWMDKIFTAVSKKKQDDEHVKTFGTRFIVSCDSPSDLPIASRITNRKKGFNMIHGRRRDVQWVILGCNVMGRRNPVNKQWTFYWQAVGILKYKRPLIDFNLKKRLNKEWGQDITKFDVFEVVKTGEWRN